MHQAAPPQRHGMRPGLAGSLCSDCNAGGHQYYLSALKHPQGADITLAGCPRRGLRLRWYRTYTMCKRHQACFPNGLDVQCPAMYIDQAVSWKTCFLESSSSKTAQIGQQLQHWVMWLVVSPVQGEHSEPSQERHQACQTCRDEMDRCQAASSQVDAEAAHQRLPARFSWISCSVGAPALLRSRAYMDMTKPGVQKPHWLPCELASLS